jgi:predicted nucleic acid-binding protein
MLWVVSDSSTLIHLARIGRLDLLRKLYTRIKVTPAVWREVVDQGEGRAGALEVASAHEAGWIEVATPSDESLVRLLTRDLGDGESEVIALAIERRADLVLLDEAEARRTADIYNLPKTGVIGILIRAKRDGEIESLRTELDRLREAAGFWVEDGLYRRALTTVGEE